MLYLAASYTAQKARCHGIHNQRTQANSLSACMCRCPVHEEGLLKRPSACLLKMAPFLPRLLKIGTSSASAPVQEDFLLLSRKSPNNHTCKAYLVIMKGCCLSNSMHKSASAAAALQHRSGRCICCQMVACHGYAALGMACIACRMMPCNCSCTY